MKKLKITKTEVLVRCFETSSFTPMRRALFVAEKWCLENDHEVTKVVRPQITKMRVS